MSELDNASPEQLIAALQRKLDVTEEHEAGQEHAAWLGRLVSGQDPNAEPDAGEPAPGEWTTAEERAAAILRKGQES